MKVIPLSEAKAKLSRYGQLCHDEPVVVTVNGKPSFQLVPLEEDDDLIDRLIEHHPGFGKLLECRLRERSISVDAASRRLMTTVSPRGRRARR
jgi:prevent-host-death family protein